jgi:flagellar protein FlbD
MIRLTRINHKPLVLNSDLIEHIEITPDTVISLTTGQKIMVLEPASEIVDKVVEFRRAIIQAWAGGPRVKHERDIGTAEPR